MKIRIILALSLITSGFILGHAFPSFAAFCPLVLSPGGNGVYVIQGTGLEKVGAIDITVSYDTSALANPRVSAGTLLSGAMQAVNAAEPGVIRMVAVNAQGIDGSGTIASMSFDPMGGSPVISLQYTLADVKGATLPVQCDAAVSAGSSSTASGDAVSSPGSGTTGTTTSQSSSSGSDGKAIWLGGVSLQTGDISTLEGRERESRDKAAPEPAPAEPAPEPRQEAKPQTRAEEPPPSRAESRADKPEQPAPASAAARMEKMPVPTPDVLERFRIYRGERNMASFIALFDRKEANGFRQEPPVAISDGASRVIIRLSLPGAGKPAPEFVLKEARLISLKADGNQWIVEALPEKGTYTASLSATFGATVVEFPLVVAPRAKVDLDKTGKVTDKDFALYLKRRAAKKPAKSAVKAKKHPQYVDDYIFTANYLAARQKPAAGDTAAPRK